MELGNFTCPTFSLLINQKDMWNDDIRLLFLTFIYPTKTLILLLFLSFFPSHLISFLLNPNLIFHFTFKKQNKNKRGKKTDHCGYYN